jgi:protein-S-isoprenylcysteine O-methyltransferase Ste14
MSVNRAHTGGVWHGTAGSDRRVSRPVAAASVFAGRTIRRRRRPTFILARAATYATLFIGLFLIVLPARVISWTGVAWPSVLGPVEVGGIALAVAGAALALWCILTFVLVGKGTPAVFDPPRELVVRGPYHFVRNPMYIAAVMPLGGAAIVYHSLALLGYMLLFGAVTHLFVVWYEEPTLHRLFGADYEAYQTRVHRWLPRV